MIKHDKADLFSGGGSWGAAGVALSRKYQRTDSTLIMGWSTGALIAPLVALGKFDLLRYIYCNVSQKDIFDVNPFTKKGNINIVNVLSRTIRCKATLGETFNLKTLIDTYFTEGMFNELQESGKEVVVVASNLKNKNLKVEYFSSNDCDYETFTQAMWASASPPLLGSIVPIGNEQYIDAGAVELISFDYAVARGAKDINAVIHRPVIETTQYSNPVKKWWDLVGRLVPGIMNETVSDDVVKGANKAELQGCKVNLIYMPVKPTFTSMTFDKEKMTDLYKNSM